MPRYLSLVKYKTEALQGVRESGYASRPPITKQLAKSLGVTLESQEFLMPGGEWDFVTIMSADDIGPILAMGSFAEATGVIERSVSYELFNGEQIDAAISKAAPEYSPPGTS